MIKTLTKFQGPVCAELLISESVPFQVGCAITPRFRLVSFYYNRIVKFQFFPAGCTLKYISKCFGNFNHNVASRNINPQRALLADK